MRVPGTKIYRAFDELDRFSDEQCERFLATAQRPVWMWVMRWILYVWAGALVLLIGMIAASMLLRVVYPVSKGLGNGGWIWFALLVTVLPASAAVFSAVLLRDLMLRTLVRRVIGTRGVCRSCGYRLLGLPVTETCKVKCPECGDESDVDPSIGELAMGADGLRTFANVE